LHLLLWGIQDLVNAEESKVDVRPMYSQVNVNLKHEFRWRHFRLEQMPPRELLDSDKDVVETDVVRKALDERGSSGTLKKDDALAQLDKRPQQISLPLLATKVTNGIEKVAFGKFLEPRKSLKDKIELHIQTTEPVLWIALYQKHKKLFGVLANRRQQKEVNRPEVVNHKRCRWLK
jgi:hypothetical protein